MENEIYQLFLNRLEEIREYEWNAHDLKIWGEYREGCFIKQKGVSPGENSLQAIARHMTEVLTEFIGSKNAP